MGERKVVITGLGAITPVGNTIEEMWSSLIKGQGNVGRITSFDATDYPCQIAAEVKNFDPEQYVDKKALKRLDKFIIFALAAAKQAWEQANISEGTYNPQRCGCIVGVGIGGMPILEENLRELIAAGPRKVTPMLIPAMISNLAPGNIAIQYNLKGINYAMTSACSSGTHAVGEAFRMIKDGLQDMIVTGGAESAITPLAIAGFGRMKALTGRNDDPAHASRPFDKDRDGFIMGEGSGIMILEEYEAAKKRGANILGEVAGYGYSCDAYHITAPAEGGEGAISCMKMAIESSRLDPRQVGYINAHGTSTPINDPAETAAIKVVFGDYAKKGLLVSSTKSMTGHLLGAAGGVEAVISCLAIYRSMIPPTINLDNPDKNCDLDYVPHKAREASVEAAISNSFGFGGTNATILIKRV
ncbi:MAG: beta-ketoacyl-ACP synthase II [Deltaproteobacteria bacterium]|nr:beta-ketoacyl-ACP synthase II [Deltaproteobacteria bacterium]